MGGGGICYTWKEFPTIIVYIYMCNSGLVKHCQSPEQDKIESTTKSPQSTHELKIRKMSSGICVALLLVVAVGMLGALNSAGKSI